MNDVSFILIEPSEPMVHEAKLFNVIKELKVKNLSISCNDTFVVIEGQVDSFYLKQLVQEIARKHIKDKRLRNLIRVKD